MSIFTRLFGPRSVKESRAWQAILLLLGRNAQWTPKDYAKLSQAGYQNCDAVYACVSLISRSAGRIEWMLQRKGRGEGGQPILITDHQLLDLLNRPNPMESGSQFTEKVIAYYLLSGNTFVEAAGPTSGSNRGRPRELYSIRPDRIKILPGDGVNELVEGFIYGSQENAVKFTNEEMLHIKTFHPTNDLWGLSPLEVAAKNIDISNMGLEWNMKLLQNDARPPGALSTDNDLEDEQFERLKEEVKTNIGGYKNAGNPLLLEAGLKWQSFALAPKEMDWLNGDIFNRRKIAIVFNVPPEMIGDSESKTYSNYQEARKSLYMETILPHMDTIKNEYNAWLVPKFGDNLVLDYNRDKIEAIQEDRGKKYEYLTKANFMSINEKRAEAGLDDWGGEGDVILVPRMQLPLGSELAGTSITTGVETTTKLRRLPRAKAMPGGFWQDSERKRALWDNFILLVKANEKGYIEIATKYMQQQADDFREAITGIGTIELINVENIFTDIAAVKQYTEDFKTWYEATLRLGGEEGLASSKGTLLDLETKQELNLFELTDELELQLQEMVFNSGTQVNATTIDMIYLKMKAAITKTMTVEEFTQLIWKHMKEDWPTWRSRLWARTESAKVENWGNLEGYKQSKFINARGWLSAFAKHSRDEHIIADADYSDNPVPLDEPFSVGGELLMFPGDAAGSAWNVCNCLCSTFPDVREAR